MHVLGITGGVATGKTTFTHALRQYLEAEVFNADACAKELLDADPGVHAQIRAQFGSQIFDETGKPDRRQLRETVFADTERRRALEAILHPAIRARWIALARSVRNQWLFVDIPLLFETSAESFFERIVVVACSSGTQRRRLVTDRQLTPHLAGQMIAAQLPLELKIQKAGHMIWNESSRAALDGQARLFAEYLKPIHG